MAFEPGFPRHGIESSGISHPARPLAVYGSEAQRHATGRRLRTLGPYGQSLSVRPPSQPRQIGHCRATRVSRKRCHQRIAAGISLQAVAALSGSHSASLAGSGIAAVIYVPAAGQRSGSISRPCASPSGTRTLSSLTRSAQKGNCCRRSLSTSSALR